jgi:hypothetical protein
MGAEWERCGEWVEPGGAGSPPPPADVQQNRVAQAKNGGIVPTLSSKNAGESREGFA